LNNQEIIYSNVFYGMLLEGNEKPSTLGIIWIVGYFLLQAEAAVALISHYQISPKMNR